MPGNGIPELKQEYYELFTEIFKALRDGLDIVDTVNDWRDPRWEALCKRFDKIAKDAPPELSDYADSMVRLHVEEVEKRWRWKK